MCVSVYVCECVCVCECICVIVCMYVCIQRGGREVCGLVCEVSVSVSSTRKCV